MFTINCKEGIHTWNNTDAFISPDNMYDKLDQYCSNNNKSSILSWLRDSLQVWDHWIIDKKNNNYPEQTVTVDTNLWVTPIPFSQCDKSRVEINPKREKSWLKWSKTIVS